MVRKSTYDPKEPVVEYEAPEEPPKFESVDVDSVLFALEDEGRDLYGNAEEYDPDGPRGEEAAPEGPADALSEEEVKGAIRPEMTAEVPPLSFDEAPTEQEHLDQLNNMKARIRELIPNA